MSLIVEDGTGKVDAESYNSVAATSTYCAAMGYATWGAATEADQEIALRRASQFLDSNWSFPGCKLVHMQALEWPRDWYPDDNVTWPIKNLTEATAELAVKALAGALSADEDDRAVKSEKVGPIAIEYGDSRYGGQMRYALVDNLMNKLTAGSRYNIRVERA